MVYLNGKFIEKDKAYVSVMDRGFLFGDSVYEVLPVYKGNIFCIKPHLERLSESLNTIKIPNPHTFEQWRVILQQLIDHHPQHDNQSIYLQVTRGCDTDRKHTYGTLKPTIYMQSSPFEVVRKEDFLTGVSAITRDDIRWSQCNTKVTSLLANIMYAQEAKQNNVEDVILCRDNIVTECSSSNIFIVKNGCVYTHPKGPHILPGITREVVLECANYCGINIKEVLTSKEDLFNADEVWVSSSTREVLPITKIDDVLINQGQAGELWSLVYDRFQVEKSLNI
ncbi:MAG: aminotransferase class IV [Gammaproteobacteria bacterium]